MANYYISTGGYAYNNAGDRYDRNKDEDFNSISEAKDYLDNVMNKKEGFVVKNGYHEAEKKDGVWKN